MKKINKGSEPESLALWKRRNRNKRYQDVNSDIRQDIRKACVSEQFYLCAYCCAEIDADNHSCHNEHVEAQYIAPNRTLDYNNIVASCNTNKQCGHSHASKDLPLTPLMDECESEFKFYINGKVKGLSERAKKSIDILNLGDEEQKNRYLIETRKRLIESLIYEKGEKPGDIQLLDDELIDILINDISQPKDFKLVPFSPVLVNILRGWQAA